MTVAQVLDWLDAIAPFAMQEGFDNAGLLIGEPNATVKRVLFTLDATLPVINDALHWGAELIITHHPLMFGGIRHIRYDEPEGAVLAALTKAHLHLIAAHTNLDQAALGTGQSLALALGIRDAIPASPDPYLWAGTLNPPQTAALFLEDVNATLGAHARLYGNPNTLVRHVAMGAGAYGEGYASAVSHGCDAYVVGEIKHHELLGALACGLTIFEAGHYATEQPGIAALYKRFLADAQEGQWPITARLTPIQPFDCHTA